MTATHDAPRIQNAPVSPVRVNFQNGSNWAQPTNGNIEESFMDPELAQFEMVDRTHQLSLNSPKASASGAAKKASTPKADIDSRDFQESRQPDGVPGREDGHSAMNPAERVRNQDLYRNSRESDDTASTQQQASTESSATTSASSVTGPNENPDCQIVDAEDSPGSSVIESGLPRNHSVSQFQYHHQQFPSQPARVNSVPLHGEGMNSTPDLIDGASHVRRHLTPTSQYFRRSSLPRPQSSYSLHSDMGPRGRSPGLMPGGSHLRGPSQSRKSPDVRMSTYGELLNAPYPQQAPAPLTLDNSNLRTAIGNNASLLSTQKTLEMYRQNVKKTTDVSIQYSFAIFLISTAQEQGLDYSDPKGSKASPQPLRDLDSPVVEASVTSPHELIREARTILQRLASAGYPFAQYYLADGYASGVLNKGKEDLNQAFPLFVLAAKHGHAEAAFRAALCYEFGWGCRKDPIKAVQFLRTAASKRHPGAMTRLGKACLSGDLGEKRYREGIKWMKLASEAADVQYNHAPYQLGCLYEMGYGDDVFQDESYAAELFTQAAGLGHPEASYRLGEAYEHGRLNCPRDASLSVHYYTNAAQAGHTGAMMGLCAWYMIGAEGMLEKDEEEACCWARKAAELGKY